LPQKEVAVDTRRHIGKGRIDSKIGAVVIESRPTPLTANFNPSILPVFSPSPLGYCSISLFRSGGSLVMTIVIPDLSISKLSNV